MHTCVQRDSSQQPSKFDTERFPFGIHNHWRFLHFLYISFIEHSVFCPVRWTLRFFFCLNNVHYIGLFNRLNKLSYLLTFTWSVMYRENVIMFRILMEMTVKGCRKAWCRIYSSYKKALTQHRIIIYSAKHNTNAIFRCPFFRDDTIESIGSVYIQVWLWNPPEVRKVILCSKQETLTPPGHLVSPPVCRGPWMPTVVLYC